MAFAFALDDGSVEEGFRRIALEQLDGALGELERAAAGDAAEAVHSVRKRCKRLRGLLRLVRRSVEDFGRENGAVRNAAAVLSSLRDAEVLDATLAAIEPKLAPETAAGLRAAIAARSATLKHGEDEASLLLRCRAALAAIRGRAPSWVLEHDGFRALGRNFADIYGQARRDMRLLGDEPSAERFHDWRKQVKYHFHHLDLLGEAAPHLLKGHRKLADELAERIGEHHDAAVFLDLIAAEPESFAALESVLPVEEALRARQDALAARAMALGRELLGEKPAALEARVRGYWKAWRSEGARDGA